MKNMLGKFAKLKQKGMTLVEIVVAIGISTVTLTTSAVFSTQLIYKSQENYMAESSAQLQNVIAEQLRLVESEMISVVNSGSGTPSAFSFATPFNYWSEFCVSNGENPLHYKIVLPNVVDNSQTFQTKLYSVPDFGSSTFVDNKRFMFNVNVLTKQQLTGAFYALSVSTRSVSVAIRKTEPPSGISGVENPILLEIVVMYYVFNKVEPTFSKIREVRMVKSLVCP